MTSAETSPSLAAIVAQVDPELPESRTQTSPEGMVTIVFTDVEGSTEMIDTMGETSWLELMVTHNRIVRDCVHDHGGNVVRSEGDGFMLLFASASASLAFAAEVQRLLADHSQSHPDQPLRVRVGAHTGNIFQSEHDFLGKAIVLAARITGRAQGGQVLISEACWEYTRRLDRWHYGQPVELELKGIRGTERVHPLEWE
ncbi:MAG: adenylate/guanylate cyclase domain-containing protein [Solirubrobacteraceae bacterium]